MKLVKKPTTMPGMLSGKHVRNDIRNTSVPNVRLIDLYCRSCCSAVSTCDSDVASARSCTATASSP